MSDMNYPLGLDRIRSWCRDALAQPVRSRQCRLRVRWRFVGRHLGTPNVDRIDRRCHGRADDPSANHRSADDRSANHRSPDYGRNNVRNGFFRADTG